VVWGGDVDVASCPENATSCTVTMNRARNVTVRFR
jgi:hypothetical protein